VEHHVIHDLRALIDGIPPDSIVSRTVHDDARMKVTLFGFASGQELSDHTSARSAIIEILSGQVVLGLGDARFDLGPGAWAAMEPNLRHSVRAQREVVMLLTLLKTS
jgi:quercetin dioxygenase-like cupin family protein